MRVHDGGVGTNPLVLVTGGSGYLASWVIVELLRRGYRVRTTVRNLTRSAQVRATIVAAVSDPAAGDRLSFAQADLLHDAGWRAAADAADFVVHAASPMPVAEFRGKNMIVAAREGTRRVLEAAYAAGVKRVVVTSSMEAALPPAGDTGIPADESFWSVVPSTKAYDYTRSKTLAEQDAWAFVDSHEGLELSTVLPAFIQGPVLGSDYSASVSVVSKLLTGAMPAIPRIGWEIVDVRDVVDLHLLAMTSPAAAGQRFIGASGFLWTSEIVEILAEHLGTDASRLPRRSMPDALVRIGALINADLRSLVPKLGVRQLANSAKAHQVLGWTPRPAKSSIIDAADSLRAHGLV